MSLLLAETNAGSTWIMLGILVVAFVFLMIVPMFTNKKRINEYNEMVNALHPGDEILTAGGVLGKIVRIVKEDNQTKSVIISTGDKGKETTMEIEISHIRMLLTPPQVKPEENKATEQIAQDKVDVAEKKEETSAKTKVAKKSTSKKAKK